MGKEQRSGGNRRRKGREFLTGMAVVAEHKGQGENKRDDYKVGWNEGRYEWTRRM